MKAESGWLVESVGNIGSLGPLAAAAHCLLLCKKNFRMSMMGLLHATVAASEQGQATIAMLGALHSVGLRNMYCACCAECVNPTWAIAGSC